MTTMIELFAKRSPSHTNAIFDSSPLPELKREMSLVSQRKWRLFHTPLMMPSDVTQKNLVAAAERGKWRGRTSKGGGRGGNAQKANTITIFMAS